ncbi:MAG TPA: lysylphosphatidylglycerol synthase domain-containing protein, partial [Thermodesulfobacteriota bacterium]|nr:lysylphosphatidylglycerol synthase domain-containing protein [Thermodesulfobacteriota bacterium]
FLYISLGFLVVFLFKYDFLTIHIHQIDVLYLIISVILLETGFLLNTLSWYAVCRRGSPGMSFKAALLSHGLSIMGKYIPGKFWGVLGRAAYASQDGAGMKKLTHLSMYAQVQSVWAGMGLGVAGLMISGSMAHLLWGTSAAWLACTVGILLPLLNFTERRSLIGKGLKELSVLHRLLPWPTIIQTTILFLSFWIAWTIGFSFLVRAFFPDVGRPLDVALAFPLATAIGIVAIVFPGGLGVREGLLIVYLSSIGMPLEAATTCSMVSRLWFLVGEVSLFGTAAFTRFRESRAKRPS